MSVPLPKTLSPSKVSRFTQCPLAFRYSYIDQLPEPPTVAQVRGTLVHRALELLFSENAPERRTRQRAGEALTAAFAGRGDWKEYAELALDDAGESQLLGDSEVLLDRYFELEDPSRVDATGLELHLTAHVGDIELSGIIDRLDDLGDGEFAVVDYKTGASPNEMRSRSSFAGVSFYAVLCEENYGRPPREVRLIYLRDQVILVQAVSEQQVRASRQRAQAVWTAISRACATEDFRPHPSALCRSCSFRGQCPVFASEAAQVEVRTA